MATARRSVFDLLFPASTILLVAYVVLPPLLLLSLSLSTKFDLIYGFLPDGISFAMYAEALPRLLHSLRDSLMIAVPTVLLSILFGVPAAYAVVRCRFPGRWLVQELINLPLLFPSVVLAFGLLQFFNVGPIADMPVVGILILAHTTVATPLMIRPVMAAMQRLDPAPEEAAVSLGAGAGRAFVSAALPIILPAFMTGIALVFARSISDFEITVLLTDPQIQPLTIAVYSAFETGSARLGAATAMAANVFTVAAILLLEMGIRRAKWW
jgi:putative spermidine/putrescine transport system permease protein